MSGSRSQFDSRDFFHDPNASRSQLSLRPGQGAWPRLPRSEEPSSRAPIHKSSLYIPIRCWLQWSAYLDQDMVEWVVGVSSQLQTYRGCEQTATWWRATWLHFKESPTHARLALHHPTQAFWEIPQERVAKWHAGRHSRRFFFQWPFSIQKEEGAQWSREERFWFCERDYQGQGLAKHDSNVRARKVSRLCHAYESMFRECARHRLGARGEGLACGAAPCWPSAFSTRRTCLCCQQLPQCSLGLAWPPRRRWQLQVWHKHCKPQLVLLVWRGGGVGVFSEASVSSGYARHQLRHGGSGSADECADRFARLAQRAWVSRSQRRLLAAVVSPPRRSSGAHGYRIWRWRGASCCLSSCSHGPNIDREGSDWVCLAPRHFASTELGSHRSRNHWSHPRHHAGSRAAKGPVAACHFMTKDLNSSCIAVTSFFFFVFFLILLSSVSSSLKPVIDPKHKFQTQWQLPCRNYKFQIYRGFMKRPVLSFTYFGWRKICERCDVDIQETHGRSKGRKYSAPRCVLTYLHISAICQCFMKTMVRLKGPLAQEPCNRYTRKMLLTNDAEALVLTSASMDSWKAEQRSKVIRTKI